MTGGLVRRGAVGVVVHWGFVRHASRCGSPRTYGIVAPAGGEIPIGGAPGWVASGAARRARGPGGFAVPFRGDFEPMDDDTHGPAYDDGPNPVSTPLDEYAAAEPGSPGAVEVHVLIAHPDDSTSFVVDVYGSRAAAEREAALFTDAGSATEVRGFLVDALELPLGGW